MDTRISHTTVKLYEGATEAGITFRSRPTFRLQGRQAWEMGLTSRFTSYEHDERYALVTDFSNFTIRREGSISNNDLKTAEAEFSKRISQNEAELLDYVRQREILTQAMDLIPEHQLDTQLHRGLITELYDKLKTCFAA